MLRLRARPLQRRAALAGRCGWLLRAALLVWVATRSAAAEETPTAARVGIHTTFEQQLDRQRARERGYTLVMGPNPGFPSPWLGEDTDPGGMIALQASATLATVFQVGGPGYIPAPPDYYLAEGVFAVFDPPSYDDPSLRVRAVSRQAFEAEQAQRWFDAARAARAPLRRAAEQERAAGGGLTVTVPIKMPGALSEIFGRGATSIKVTGRENLTFAGESRRVSDFKANESGRGQSLFPRLDMQQDLQVKLEGTIGDKVHVQVDHNSAGLGADANRINIYYQGYDDDIVRRVDLGGTSLSLPGSGLVSYSGGGQQGLFGIKSELRLGGLDLHVIASKQQADVQTGTFSPGGGTSNTVNITENGFIRDRCFFYERPDPESILLYDTYGIDPALLYDQTWIGNMRVFIEDQNASTVQNRPFRGFAVAALPVNISPDSMTAAWNAAPEQARFPLLAQDGNWREVPAEELGWILLRVSTQAGVERQLVLGFYLRNTFVNKSMAIGIAINDPSRTLGQVGETALPPSVKLRLLRHPDQETDFTRYPTSLCMMRHAYALGATELGTSPEVRILAAGTQLNPEKPLNFNSTYLHMYGLDELDQAAGTTRPDDKFDYSNPNLLDTSLGLLLMPGVRPFSPPEPIIVQRLVSAGVSADSAQAFSATLFPENERVSGTLYTLPAEDQNLPRDRFTIEATITGAGSAITLPQDIIEGSEIVKVGEITLTRGVDYDIEPFFGGRITLKGDALAKLAPGATISVTYQYLPTFGGGKSSLLGVSANYEFGSRARVGSVLLYESTGSASKRVKFGEEPSRTVVGDLNGQMRFTPGWMTRLVDALPLTNALQPSLVQMQGEIAMSQPDPNTRQTAYVDDLEGADESDEINLSRGAWAWASIPIDTPSRADPALRVPTAFYNPVGRVKRGYLNPELDSREVNDGITVLEMGFDRSGLDTLAARPDAKYLWSGIMRSFGTAGLDLSRTKSIDFWLNDGVGNPHERHGTLHIDFGDMSEDFVFLDTGFADNPRFNREETLEALWTADNDLGWDRTDADCPGENLPRNPEEWRTRFAFGSECYYPEAINPDLQHFLANGSEGNKVYDTEDLNNNGIFDERNNYFSIAVPLADPTWIITDVAPLYANDPTVPQDLRGGFGGWRKYRIDLERVQKQILSATGSSPNLRKISYLRLWFEDDAPINTLFRSNLQLYELRFTRNQYVDLGVFTADGPRTEPVAGESFTVGTINNKEDSAIYELPPDAIELDTQGVQAREQSLRIGFTNLQPGHEVVAERQLAGAGRGIDFTEYTRLTYFVHYPASAAAAGDTAEFFFRVGSDTLNFYEIAHTIPSRGRWMELNVDFDQITGLKFPEDYPGAVVDTLVFGAQTVYQYSAPTADARDPTLPLRVAMRGAPSLTSVSRFQVGVRVRERPVGHPLPALQASGEVWFDNVRLDNPERSLGAAQAYSITAKFSDVFDLTGQYSKRDADFRGLRERTGRGNDQVGLQTTLHTEVSRLAPTFGFVIPFDLSYGHDRAEPKFATQSDTRNTDERKNEQRTERVRRSFGFRITKRPSRTWIEKVTLDRLQLSYSTTRDQGRTYTSRDTTRSTSRSLVYDLSPRERGVKLWGSRPVNFLPNNLKFSVQDAASTPVRYTVSHLRRGTALVDSLVRVSTSSTKSVTLNASASFRPVQGLNLRYNMTEPRDFRLTHPQNQAEGLRFLGYRFGLPLGRTETLALDLTPRKFQFNWSTSYSDQRTLWGTTRPETHSANSNRSARLHFDFGLHRQLLGRLVARQPAAGPGGPAAPRPAPREPVRQVPPPPPEEPAPEREDLAPRSEVAVDSLAPGPGPAVPATGPATLPPAAAAPAGPAAARPDSATQRPRPSPLAPLVGVLRMVAGIEAVRVDLTDARVCSYTGLADSPTGAFRYGLSRHSGLPGVRAEVPPSQNLRQAVELQTGVPLRGALRLGVKYKLDASVIESRNFNDQDVLTNVSENHRQETTFPSLDLSINKVERLRIFRSALTSSNVTLGYSRSTSESYSLNQRPGTLQATPSALNTSGRSTLTANWAGQWRHGISSSLNLTQSTTSQGSPSPREGVQRSLTGTMRFRVAPKGGLRLPFLGSRGVLKSGMDVTFTGNYSTNQSTFTSDPATGPKTDGQTSTIQLGARGDYTLSRNMSGGVDLGFTRNSDALAKRSITAVRLGFTISLMF